MVIHATWNVSAPLRRSPGSLSLGKAGRQVATLPAGAQPAGVASVDRQRVSRLRLCAGGADTAAYICISKCIRVFKN